MQNDDPDTSARSHAGTGALPRARPARGAVPRAAAGHRCAAESARSRDAQRAPAPAGKGRRAVRRLVPRVRPLGRHDDGTWSSSTCWSRTTRRSLPSSVSRWRRARSRRPCRPWATSGCARADPPRQPGRGGARPEPSGQRWPGDAAAVLASAPQMPVVVLTGVADVDVARAGAATGRPGLAGQGAARPRRRAARRALCGRAQAPDRSAGPGAEAGDRRPAGQRRRARVQQRPHRDRRQRPARRGGGGRGGPRAAPWICCAAPPARASR